MITVHVTLLLAVILFFLLRRKTQARSRVNETLTALIAVFLGIFLVKEDYGDGIFAALVSIVSVLDYYV